MSETATLRDTPDAALFFDLIDRVEGIIEGAHKYSICEGFADLYMQELTGLEVVAARCKAALLAAPLPLRSEKEEEDAIARLRKWREWAQFVFKDGGPATGTDDELRAAICARADAIEREWR